MIVENCLISRKMKESGIDIYICQRCRRQERARKEVLIKVA